MTIEIICKGCSECMIVRGKICQALADLNLNAEVVSIFEPFNMAQRCLNNQPELRIDGQSITTSRLCSVKELKSILDERTLSGA